MLDAFPGHVGDVQQAVDAAQVDKRAVVGEVFDDTFNGLTFLQVLQQFFALGTVGLFHHRAARYHHVVALLVEFNNLEFQFFAFQVSGFAHWAHIHQRTRQERADTIDINGKATLDLAVDDAGGDLIGLVG